MAVEYLSMVFQLWLIDMMKKNWSYEKSGDGFLAAISREDLDLNVLHKYKVCEGHFHSGKPAYLYNTTEVTLLAASQQTTWQYSHYANFSGGYSSRQMEKGSGKVKVETEEIRVIAVEQVEMAKQYFKPADHHECKIEALQKELAKCKAQNVQ